MTTTSTAVVLGRRASVDAIFCGAPENQILSTCNDGKPLLFADEASAWAYFADHAGGQSPEALQAFVREANAYELEIGEVA